MIYSLAPSQRSDTVKNGWYIPYGYALLGAVHAYGLQCSDRYSACNIKGTAWSQAVSIMYIVCEVVYTMCKHNY